MKTKMISTRISEELEQKVVDFANEYKWTKSFALGEILRQFFCRIKEN